MKFFKIVTEFAEKAKTLKPHIQSEEATKTALIMPFFQQVLGWDVFNPQEFAPEYKANFKSNGNDRVDFAILLDDKPVILIEAKYIGESLESHIGQLSGYYAPTEAKFAVLTNGLQYRFYSDIMKKNIMDTVPFLDIDLLALDVRAVAELEHFSKCLFNIDTVAVRAFELLYENIMYARLSKEIESPSDEFVRLLLDSSDLSFEQLKSIAKSAIQRYMSDNAVEIATTPLEENLSDTSNEAPQFTAKQLKAIEDVKAIIATTGSKHRYKVKEYLRKKHCGVEYRRVTVCAFPFGDDNDISSIRFWGTTIEKRKQISEFPLLEVKDFAPQIIKQLEFIDWWYLNPKPETGGVE